MPMLNAIRRTDKKRHRALRYSTEHVFCMYTVVLGLPSDHDVPALHSTLKWFLLWRG